MTRQEFISKQEQYRTEAVLFFFPTSHPNTGDVIATDYTREQMAEACIAAIPLSDFAYEWNNGSYEAIPDIRDTWCAMSLNAAAIGSGMYNTRYEERARKSNIVTKFTN